MVSTEVKRTIVKSPPELWAQVSDAATLMRHLGEFGEIRITRAEPEKIVEWEAELASGKVQIKPSGWGTQVLLSVTRQLPEPALPEIEPLTATDAQQVEPQSGSEPESVREREPQPDTVEIVAEVSEPAVMEPEPIALEPRAERSEPDPEIVEPAPRRGFFARLFKRERQRTAADSTSTTELTGVGADSDHPADSAGQSGAEQQTPIADEEASAAAPAAEQEPAASHSEEVDPDQEAAAEEPAAADTSQLDIAAELAQAEELLSEQTAVVLSSMLDRLGAAHHRPFSRG
jgi:hypothetical protein